MAIRLSKVIHSLISPDQVGFMKGRNISTLLRLIDDVIDLHNTNNQAGLIVAIDPRVAFDSISKDYMFYAFDKFGFGEKFVRWVKVLFTNSENSINYLGWISGSFKLHSGIRQGCPFSPLAFILALELLAIKIRTDPTIKGLNLPGFPSVPDIKLKLALYADDITLFLKDQNDVQNTLTLIKQYSKFSGLDMNEEKSNIMGIGTEAANKQDVCGLECKQKLKILGVIFKNNCPASEVEENWTARFERISKLISLWSKRNLSIAGKICITKAILIPQFVYIMQAFSLPSDVLIKFNTLLFRFIWKKRFSNTRAFEKVKRNIICKDIESGGLKMINVIDMQKSFLMSWVGKLHNTVEQKWKAIPLHYYGLLGRLTCFNSNVKSSKFAGLHLIKNAFWRQVLITWLDNKSLLQKEKQLKFLDEPLWNNNRIVFKKKPLFLKDWARAQICQTRDIWTDGNMLSFEDICQKVGVKPSRLFEYNAVVSAIRARYTRLPEDHGELAANEFLIKPSQIRNALTKANISEPISVKIWERKFSVVIDKDHWLVANRSTKETRLRLIHWKILHNIYPSNLLLMKMGLKQSKNCDYCPSEIDYVEHFFFQCSKIRSLWTSAENLILKLTGAKLQLTCADVLCGYQVDDSSEENKLINHIILIGKMCVGIFRYGQPLNITCIFERECRLRIRGLDE